MNELEKAAAICAAVAEQRKRWGKHAGFGEYADWQVLDALVAVHDAGLFDLEDAKKSLVAANRAKGAAEARATRAQKRVEALSEELDQLKAKLGESKSDSEDK